MSKKLKMSSRTSEIGSCWSATERPVSGKSRKRFRLGEGHVDLSPVSSWEEEISQIFFSAYKYRVSGMSRSRRCRTVELSNSRKFPVDAT